ncbi:hypothetical protein [Actinopolymorpha alba]|uniref:hypothetical protein n=1 Tax=Actinopolymorpha alba TaxID=533267 RepID=UPI0003679DAB|nr:hypothetical protein [Actinopolymorpha alba]
MRTDWALRASAVVRVLRGLPPWLLVLAVLALAVAGWSVLQGVLPYLGHDEAVYATKARSWLTGAPAAQWDPRRAPGLPALGYLALAVHPSEGAVRLVGLGLLLVTLVLVYVAAAAATSPRRAVVVLLLVLTGPGFFRRTPEFLGDIGAAGMLVGVAFSLARAQERRGRSGGSARGGTRVGGARVGGARAGGGDLVLAAVFALGAFYLRYGATAGLLALMLAAVVAWGPRSWFTYGRWLAGAAGIVLAGMVPHLLFAGRVTGSPFGLLVDAGESANPAYVGDGLVYYVRTFPALAGPLGAVVMAAGLLAAALAGWRILRGRARPGADRRTVFVGLAAGLVFVLLGLTAHGEPRFVFLAVILLLVLGVQSLASWAGRWSPALLAGMAVTALVTLPATYTYLAGGSLAQVTRTRAALVEVAETFRGERDCLLVTGYQPELGWYSGCATASVWQARSRTLPPGRRVSYVLFEHGRAQPSEAEVRGLAGGHPIDVRVLPATGPLGAARILTIR